MGRRWTIRGLAGERFCGDRDHKMVHDLDHEDAQCHIDDIIQHAEAMPFRTLEEAHMHGYHDCPYCFKLPWVDRTPAR